MKQLTREEAIAFDHTNLSDVEKFTFQLHQNRLCMSLDELYRCASVAMKRPVYTHEFADRDSLLAELESGEVISLSAVIEKLDQLIKPTTNGSS